MIFQTDKTRLAAALLALSIMPMTMTACGGTPCGDNTEENGDGECVPTIEAVTCADGTVLSEGQCVLDTTGCGANTTLEDGVCVPAETGCSNGTTFNTATGECEAAEVCGAGTSVNADGQCVPAAGACAAGTTLNADGTCEVAAAACGSGTTLDAATGTCALGDMVCGENTVLANGSCTVIADACEAGTTFNEGTGTCTPEATCKPGDTISNGICITPAEALAEMATVTIPAGNTNPGFDGTPVDITLPAAGTPLVITGAIEAPYDHDSDPETPDIQDLDFVKVTATGAQLIKVSVQPTNASSIPFLTGVIADIDGLDYDRTALPLGPVSSRFVMLPVAGDYLIPVIPRAFNPDSPVGSDAYTYVLTVEDVALPTPAAASAGMMGSFADLSDNFYDLDGSGAATPITFTFEELGSSADYTLHYFNAANGGFEYIRTEEIDGDVPFDVASLDPVEDTVIVFDWDGATGTDLGYRASVANSTNIEALGSVAVDTTAEGTMPASLAPGESYWYTFDVQAGQLVEVDFESDSSGSIRATVYDGSGVSVGSGSISSSATSFTDFVFFAEAAGSYTVNVENTSTSTTRDAFKFTARSFTPLAVQDLVGGTPYEFAGPAIVDDERQFLVVRTATDIEVSGALAAEDDLDLQIRNNADRTTPITTGGFGNVDNYSGDLVAGTYIVRIAAYGDSPSYTLDFNPFELPATEVEPNEDDATATPFSLNSRGANGELAGPTDVDVFSFSPNTDMAAGEVFVLRVNPDSAAGATPTFTCEVRGPAGPIATATTVSNECVMFLTGLLAADTYTLDIRTDSADAVGYDITFETINGQVEDPAANNVINIGSLGGAGAPADVFIGELVTDGTNPSVDAITFRIDSIDAGQLLIANIEPIYNRAEAPAIEAEIVDATSQQVAQVTAAPYQFALDTVTTGIYTLNLTRPDTDAGQTFRYRVTLQIATKVVGSATPNVAIDSATPIHSSTINVAATCIITDLVVPVDFDHAYAYDLDISITSPAGTTVVLQTSAFISGADRKGTYGVDLTPEGDLSDFVGEDAAGTWTMNVEDTFSFSDDGFWNSWGIEANCQ